MDPSLFEASPTGVAHAVSACLITLIFSISSIYVSYSLRALGFSLYESHCTGRISFDMNSMPCFATHVWPRWPPKMDSDSFIIPMNLSEICVRFVVNQYLLSPTMCFSLGILMFNFHMISNMHLQDFTSFVVYGVNLDCRFSSVTLVRIFDRLLCPSNQSNT